MASKKKLLQAAAGAAGGGAGLDVDEVFSTYLYDGTGSAQVIENGIALGNDGDGGSILLEAQADGLEITQSSDFNFGTGDFTCEAWVWLNDTNTTYRTMLGFDVTLGLLFQVVNMKLDLGLRGTSTTASTSSLTANQWNHLAVVRSSGTVYLFINGTLDRTATTDSSGTSWSTRNLSNSTNALIGDYSKTATNFNGRISNLRVSTTARYTSTFTVPTSALSSDANTVLLIGQNDDPFSDQSSSSHSATPYGSPSKSNFGPFTGTSGEGGLVWTKTRNESAYQHWLFDTERGATKRLFSALDSAEATISNGLTSFNSNGFTVGAYSGNETNDDIVSWTWRKAPKFFDVVTYTGNTVGGSAQTISHGLGSNVGMIIVKRYSTADNWVVWHRYNANAVGFLNLTNQFSTTNASSFISSVSSTSFTVGESLNTNGESFVAYLFAHNNGDGEFGPDSDQDVIKCGSYTGNGSTTGPTVDLGFEPQWLLIKDISTAQENWQIFDQMRGMPVGGQPIHLYPNSSAAEGSVDNQFEITPTGFKLTSVSNRTNASGRTYIYMAIRRGPLAEPTSATDVFAIDTQSQSSAPYAISNFPVDFALRKDVDGSSTDVHARLTQGQGMFANSTSAEGSDNIAQFDYQNGYLDNTSQDTTKYAWMWKRAPSYFDVVAYIGNDTAGRTVSHNLGAVPEMMWVKRRNSTGGDWDVYHKDIGNTKYLTLNSTAAASTSQYTWHNTTPTESVFTIATGANNTNGDNFIAYLFATVAGVSKVGSYTGNGTSDRVIDCGFSNGARFVLIKDVDTSGTNWQVFDTTRGLTSTKAELLRLNTTAAQIPNGSPSQDYHNLIEPDSSGFKLNHTSALQVNASGVDYIFYAIA